jgi:hypothetical protein
MCTGNVIRPAEKRFLRDVLAAQLFLFLYVRIHDDVFDDQHAARPLVLIADRFALEARGVLARHFVPASIFWRHYDAALRETFDAIPEVALAQRARRTSLRQLAHGYSRVGRVLAIASLSVAVRNHRSRDIPRIIRCADELSAGSQILDDLQDALEDMRGGRRNYVVRQALRHPALASMKPGRPPSLHELLAVAELGARVLAEGRRRFRRALAILRSLGIHRAEEEFAFYDGSLAEIQGSVLRRGRRLGEAALRRGTR